MDFIVGLGGVGLRVCAVSRGLVGLGVQAMEL